MRSTDALRTGVLALAIGVAACASGHRSWPNEDTYLKWVVFEVPINETVLLSWPTHRMPLRVFPPRLPAGMFEDPGASYGSVRDGVLDWAGVARPNLPDFVFVDAIGDADIPIVWAREPDSDWYVAHCAYAIQPFARRFGVSRILITARWGDGQVADPQDIYATVLHEMGHALGLGGHSPHPEDITHKSSSRTPATGLSPRDRATVTLLYERPIGTRIVGARRDE